MVNAEAAVGGLCVKYGRVQGTDLVTFTDAGPGAEQIQYHSFHVQVSGGSGNYNIAWGGQPPGPQATYGIARGTYQVSITATITDVGTGAPPLTVSQLVTVVDGCEGGGEACDGGGEDTGE